MTPNNGDAAIEPGKGRIVCHFSCGAASAVATKLAIAENAGKLPLVVFNQYVKEEHEDNLRFKADCQRWFGVPITTAMNDQYGGSIYTTFQSRKFLKGTNGAPCTLFLKKELARVFWRPGDIDVLGYAAEEQDRHDDWIDANNERRGWPILIEKKLGKADCLAMIDRAGIALPAMYLLGYDHNNCVGCVKGGMGYWNKIRVDFPLVFDRMAKVERQLGHSLNREGEKENRKSVFLDELDPERGRDVKEPSIQCSAFCELAEREYT